MGEFSFLRADVTLKRANIVEGDPISLLIPKEFGGGSIDSSNKYFKSIPKRVQMWPLKTWYKNKYIKKTEIWRKTWQNRRIRIIS